jgi:hypothetical protein
MILMLQRERALAKLKYQWHQIHFVYDFALRNGDQRLSVRQLSRVLGCDGGRAKAALDNGLNGPKVRGRHFALDDDSLIEILE